MIKVMESLKRGAKLMHPLEVAASCGWGEDEGKARTVLHGMVDEGTVNNYRGFFELSSQGNEFLENR